MEETEGRHEHACRAIATLHGIRFQEGLLEWVKLAVLLEAFDGPDLLFAEVSDMLVAGTGGRAINQNRASAALPFTAAVFAAGEAEIITQNAEESAFAIGIDINGFSIHLKLSNTRHTTARLVLKRNTPIVTAAPVELRDCKIVRWFEGVGLTG